MAIYHAHSAAAPSLRDCSDRSSAKVYLRAFIIIYIFNHAHLSSSINLSMRIHHHSRTFSFDRADLLKNQLGKMGFDRKGSEQKSVCGGVGWGGGGGENLKQLKVISVLNHQHQEHSMKVWLFLWDSL